MCLLMFLGGAILLMVTLFVKSAMILLPWTATSTILAGLIALQLGKWLGRTPRSQAAVAGLGTLALSFAIGYLAYSVRPPGVPPQPAGLAALLEAPEPTAQDLWHMFPVHLAIWAIMAAKIVDGWCNQHVRTANLETSEDKGKTSPAAARDREYEGRTKR